MTDSLNAADANALSRLLGVEEDAPPWQAAELSTIWRQHLQVALRVELLRYDPTFAATLGQLCDEAQPEINTFADLYSHPKPPSALLDKVKAYAKELGRSPHLAPTEVAGVLYLAAIAVAYKHHGQVITDASPDSLAKKFEWARQLSWLDEDFKALFCV